MTNLKLIRSIATLVLLAAVTVVSSRADNVVAQSAGDFATKAKQAILLDSKSGRVFFEKNADEPMHPASMSKIMSMIIVFEDLKSGRLKLDDEFIISPAARGAPGSRMFAEVNTRIKVRDLIRGVIVQSANDGAIAIAEGISGTQEAFAARMTQRARELGLKVSTFRNATGLTHPEHLMTARELATLTRYLIEIFPDYYSIYSEREFTWNKITQQNRNPLLKSYPGADGVKTGYVRASGYGLVGSATRSSRRLIVVVNGAKSKTERSREAKKLLDWGFRQFRRTHLFDPGETVGRARVWGGTRSWVALTTQQPVAALLADDERDGAGAELVYTGPLRAPVRQGVHVGKIRLTVDGRIVAQVPVYTKSNVPASGELWRKAWDSLSFLAFGG